MEWDGVDGINLAEGRDTRWSVVNTAVIFFLGGGFHNTLGVP